MAHTHLGPFPSWLLTWACCVGCAACGEFGGRPLLGAAGQVVFPWRPWQLAASLGRCLRLTSPTQASLGVRAEWQMPAHACCGGLWGPPRGGSHVSSSTVTWI